MSEKFLNKYRIASHRKPGWDYSSDGFYFITLVTQNRNCTLGKIEYNEMMLSDFGIIVQTEWLKSFEIRNELFLDEFILMPNHIHAIIILEKYEPNAADTVDTVDTVDTTDTTDTVDATAVETHGRASLQSQQSQQSQQSNFYRKPQSISSFIAGFKSIINTKIDDYIDENQLNLPKYNRNNHFFQPNYHDHIIRDSGEYERIKNYIANNPLNWKDDKFYE